MGHWDEAPPGLLVALCLAGPLQPEGPASKELTCLKVFVLCQVFFPREHPQIYLTVFQGTAWSMEETLDYSYYGIIGYFKERGKRASFELLN